MAPGLPSRRSFLIGSACLVATAGCSTGAPRARTVDWLAALLQTVLPGAIPPDLWAAGRVHEALHTLWSEVLSPETRTVFDGGVKTLGLGFLEGLPADREARFVQMRSVGDAGFTDAVVAVMTHFLWWFPQHDPRVGVGYAGNLVRYPGPLLGPTPPTTHYLTMYQDPWAKP